MEKINLKPKKDVVLEVGVGKEPVFLSSASSPEIIPGNSLYIGVEIGKEDLAEAKKAIVKAQAMGVKMPQEQLLVQADGENLPLPDNAVDKIIFRNIFGAPGHCFKRCRYFDFNKLAAEDLGEIINFKPEEFPFLPRTFFNKTDYLRNTLGRATVLAEKIRKDGKLDEGSRTSLMASFGLLEPERAEQQAKAHFISEAMRVLKESGQLVIVEIRTPKFAENYIKALKENPNFSLEQYSQDLNEIKKYDKQGKPENSGQPFVVVFRKTSRN